MQTCLRKRKNALTGHRKTSVTRNLSHDKSVPQGFPLLRGSCQASSLTDEVRDPDAAMHCIPQSAKARADFSYLL